jgi:hypothetical protein
MSDNSISSNKGYLSKGKQKQLQDKGKGKGYLQTTDLFHLT